MIRINLLAAERERAKKPRGALIPAAHRVTIGASVILIATMLGIGWWFWILHQQSTAIDQAIAQADVETQKLRGVLSQVQKTFDFFKASATVEHITRVVVSGGASRAEGFLEMLGERFNAPVEVFDPFKKVSFDAKKFNVAAEAVGPTVAVAVGLALRRAGDR